MNLTPKIADKIAARYSNRHWTGNTEFERALLSLVRRRGLKVLDDESLRELILDLGDERRSNHQSMLRSQAQYAARVSTQRRAPIAESISPTAMNHPLAAE